MNYTTVIQEDNDPRAHYIHTNGATPEEAAKKALDWSQDNRAYAFSRSDLSVYEGEVHTTLGTPAAKFRLEEKGTEIKLA